MNDRSPLDDAIDRTVRDMTHVAADDDAVARVMARVRGAGARGADARDATAGARWMLTPRVAWCGIIAILLMALLGRSWYPLRHQPEEQRAEVAAPQPSPRQTPPQHRTPRQTLAPPLAARDFPTRVAAAPTTSRAAAASRLAHRDALRPASIASGAIDASEQRAQSSEMTPLESDIQIASITPAPLADAAAIDVAPLMTAALTVDEIPVSSIDVPPVSPEQQK